MKSTIFLSLFIYLRDGCYDVKSTVFLSFVLLERALYDRCMIPTFFQFNIMESVLHSLYH